MEINTHELKDILDIHRFFLVFRSHETSGWWFRGQADISWPLLPKAGREEFYLGLSLDSGIGCDLGRFNAWRQDAVAYLKNLPGNDWECLALAQHHGLATRLLDWSVNPLVATFFAVEKESEKDGVVFCYDPPLFVDPEAWPLNVDRIGCGFIPRAISPRILNQRSVFTYHGPPNAQIIPKQHQVWNNHSNLARITIRSGLKRELLQHLDDYGINQVTLFPDLDGLSRHNNWKTRDIAKKRKAD